MKIPKCKDCYWWVRQSGTVGECKVNPPSVLVLEGKLVSTCPVTEEGDFCNLINPVESFYGEACYPTAPWSTCNPA